VDATTTLTCDEGDGVFATKRLTLAVLGVLLLAGFTSAVIMEVRTDMSAWSIEVVDSAGVGAFSLALDASGYPHIGFNDLRAFPSKSLKHARWDGFGWTMEDVDAVGDVGYYASLALDASGHPHISYIDAANDALKYAQWNGSQWRIDTVDAVDISGGYCSLALDASDQPHISYYDDTDDNLEYARWTGSVWTISAVDNVGVFGTRPSLVLDASGYPHISYHTMTYNGTYVGTVQYAWWNGTAWTIDRVAAGNSYHFISLALDASGHPHISYFDDTDDDLRYARWDGFAWVHQTVDAEGDVGRGTSLALDASGHPHISYIDFRASYNSSMKYAQWNGSAWSIEDVDTSPGMHLAWSTSLALDATGRPHLIYNNNGELKYAYTAPASSSETFFATNVTGVDTVGDGYWNSVVIAMDVDTTYSGSLDVSVNASLYASTGSLVGVNASRWTITGYDEEYGYVQLYAPPKSVLGYYDVELVLYDAEGHYEDYVYLSDVGYLYPSGPPGYDEALAWSIDTVDAIDVVGVDPSLALDANGFPHISYYDRTYSTLKYARWNGSLWLIDDVDAVGNRTWYSSLALDASDHPHISYYDSTFGNLKYARWTGSAWSRETVDSIGDVGLYNSLALDASAYPHISYRDYNNSLLKYARWDGAQWHFVTLDTNVEHTSSLALDADGHPHISYYDADNHALKYAWWAGFQWHLDTVDAYSEVGSASSLALDTHDYPHISYYDDVHLTLKYARWNGSVWFIEHVDWIRDVGRGSSLALDTSDHPHIAYSDHSPYPDKYDTLKYARWNGSTWLFDIVDPDISLWHISKRGSLALDAHNLPHISYYDENTTGVKYARVYDEYFFSADAVPVDTTGDGFNNSVLVAMDVDTTYSGTLTVSVNAFLSDANGVTVFPFNDTTWAITGTFVEYGTVQLYMPPGAAPDWHYITLELWDEDGHYEQRYEIPQWIYLYPPDMSTQANITLALRAPTVYLGFVATITGTATAYGQAVAGLPLLLRYSVTGGASWTPLTVVTTDSDGLYYAEWLPQATGTFLLQAAYADYATYLPTSNLVPLEVLPSPLDRVNVALILARRSTFSVVSNSTLSALTYNATLNHLACTVSGPMNTTGYVAATVAASLVPDIASLRVLLDAADLPYEALRVDDAWLLYATYPHSTHILRITFG
jgi:hypothetical protein